VKYMIATQL